MNRTCENLSSSLVEEIAWAIGHAWFAELDQKDFIAECQDRSRFADQVGLLVETALANDRRGNRSPP